MADETDHFCTTGRTSDYPPRSDLERFHLKDGGESTESDLIKGYHQVCEQ